MDLTVQFYYWHEVMGPLQIFADGNLKISEESLLILLSSIEPYSVTTESSILGPTYIESEVIVTYNRCVCNPDAQDERLRLMGSDTWVIISCSKDYELILLSKIEIVKMILDIEFSTIDELNQLDSNVGKKATFAIKKVYD
ncbi:MAG: hypothetical protein FK731_06065 [Asgard group archaeon]|nr:hypothetical protein [Asgard group archaeon]